MQETLTAAELLSVVETLLAAGKRALAERAIYVALDHQVADFSVRSDSGELDG